MSDRTNRRKIEHIRVIEDHPETNRKSGYFDQIRLTHKALPEMSLSDVDPSTTFLGKKISFPLIISSMTGGDHELLTRINRNLAIAAQATQVAMAVGSQRILFDNPNAAQSFHLRTLAPDIPLVSNLGAVQLNYGFDISHCNKAVDILQADGLYLHLNPLQECIQPEGNTDFSGLLEKIGNINKALPVPVLIKEVGCGINSHDVQNCMNAGIEYMDIAGQGGTSWSRIEYHRDSSGQNPGVQFQDWGIPTPVALRNAFPFCKDVFIIASGGLRNGLDMVKSIIMGARLCGLAAPFLKAAMDSPESIIREIEQLRHAFSIAMFLLGAKDVNYLHANSQLILDTCF